MYCLHTTVFACWIKTVFLLKRQNRISQVKKQVMRIWAKKGYHYRAKRFFNRLKQISLISKVFVSKLHGDPSMPILRISSGERRRIRLFVPADKPRNISFTLHGHRWKTQPDAPFIRTILVQGAISVSRLSRRYQSLWRRYALLRFSAMGFRIGKVI